MDFDVEALVKGDKDDGSQWKFALILVFCAVYLLFLHQSGQDSNYAETYFYVLFIGVMIFCLCQWAPESNFGMITLGNPEDIVFGLPRPMFGLAVGAVLAIVLMLSSMIMPVAPFSVDGGNEEFIKTSFGSGTMESSLFSGLIMPSIVALCLGYGIAGFTFVLLTFLVLFLQFNFVFLLISIGVIFFAGTSSKLYSAREFVNDILKNVAIAVVVGLVFSALLFQALHTNDANSAIHNSRLVFSFIADSITLLTGGIAGAIMFHIIYNGFALAGVTGLWWVPAVFWAAFVYADSYILSRG